MIDKIGTLRRILYQLFAIQGGAETLQSLRDMLAQSFDFSRIQTIASPVTLTNAAQYIVSIAGSDRPFRFPAGWLSWNSGTWAGGEQITITIDLTADGTNWENTWTQMFAAAAVPLTVPIPFIVDGAAARVPWPEMHIGENCGLRVGIVQNVIGGGWHVVSHNFSYGAPSA